MANEHSPLYIYSKYVLLITVLILLLNECIGDELSAREENEDNEEEVIVYSSAHKNQRESANNADNFAKRKIGDNTFLNHHISRIEFNTSDALRETVSNGSKSSLLEPFARLLDSYFNSRSHNGSKSENRTVTDDVSDTRNETSSESRTLASWLSETFGFPKKKRPSEENNFPYRNDLVSSSSVTGIPVGPMLAPIFRPAFLPQPEGFPGPHNPQSILLPADLLENTGIDYWLNFIENGGQDIKPASYEAAGSDAEELNFFRRPVNYPVGIGQKLNSRRPPISHYNHHNLHNYHNGNKPHNLHDDYQDDGQERYPEEEEVENMPPEKPPPKPQQFDTTPRCDKFTSHICVDDFEYPEQAIVDEIYKRRDMFELMYAEVKDNSPLVDGIPRHVEESYNYEHYYSGDGNDVSYPLASGSEVPKESSGFICPSEVLYGKPKLARNLKGVWKVIVNAAEFTQTIRMEKCLKPNERCNHITNNKVVSRCVQVNGVHRLVVFEKGKGFYIDMFRIPTACSCHVSRRKVMPDKSNHGYHSNSAIVETVDKNVPPTQLTNTLWSILGSNSLNENHNYDHNSIVSSEAVRTQLALLQHLKNHPDIASQISPDNVLQQLTSFNGLPSPQFSTVPKSSMNSYTNKYRPQKLSNGQYLLPAMYFSPEQLNSDQIKSTPPPYPHFVNYPQTHQATTYIRPGGGNAGAPVVQVIHVPVTTNPLPPVKSNVDSPQSSLHPVYQPMFQLSAYESKKSTKNSENVNSTAEDRAVMSSTALPFIEQQNMSSAASINNITLKEEEEEARRSQLKSKKIDKRINFSYHPILEYITMSTID